MGPNEENLGMGICDLWSHIELSVSLVVCGSWFIELPSQLKIAITKLKIPIIKQLSISGS